MKARKETAPERTGLCWRQRGGGHIAVGMSRTSNFRRQHDQLETMAADLLSETRRFADGDNSYAISMKLAHLMGHLKVHLAQEDNALYPSMMACEDERTARTAKRFADEMGGLAREVDALLERFPCSRAIAADYTVFRHEAHRLVGRLAERIKRENETLYPLADAMDGCSGGKVA